ncbi:hypothetical protein [Halorubrum ezzemoulense]|uniref:hypothetical protein n=1 Tax=Halorubrum ezzemoulense TaxID=337243 RepID=UPI0011404B29|nr:hypothetical protein [Halorubrum ezzemoulense]
MMELLPLLVGAVVGVILGIIRALYLHKKRDSDRPKLYRGRPNPVETDFSVEYDPESNKATVEEEGDGS